MSRSLSHLHPELRMRHSFFRSRAEAFGLDYLVTCTWRSNAEQDALYSIGRSKPGKIVTMAKGGESNHNFMMDGLPASLAFDIVPLRFGKVLVWGTTGNGIDSDPTDDDRDDLELWHRFGAIARDVGLEWYGEPGSPFRELPHFQLMNATEIRKVGW